MWKKILYINWLIFISILFVFASVFFTTDTAFNEVTLTHLEYGWPIRFVVQDQSFFDPPFPYEMDFTLNDTVTSKINPLKLLLALGINFILLFSISFLINRIVTSYSKVGHFPSSTS